jgi:hypothetical protein
MFSHLSTFISHASDQLNLSPDTIRQNLTKIIGKGDVYVARYLANCYLNPFEDLNSCSEFKDINNYFLYDTKETAVNIPFLVDIVNVVEQKLENTQVPSLVMQFDRYTPGAKSLSFSVTINTFVEDERAFLDE